MMNVYILDQDRMFCLVFQVLYSLKHVLGDRNINRLQENSDVFIKALEEINGEEAEVCYILGSSFDN